MGTLRPAFVAQLESAAEAFGVELQWVSDQWVALLRQKSRNAVVVGYTFPLNNAAAAELANDKVAAFEMLRSGGLPLSSTRLSVSQRPRRRQMHQSSVSLLRLSCGPLW